jgi:predicted DNA binding CopG/RHH family protein
MIATADKDIMNLNDVIYTSSASGTMIDKYEAEPSVRCPSSKKSEADMNKNKKLVSFRLSEELLESLRERADEDGVTVTELVTRLLKQGLQTSDNDRIAVLEAEIKKLQQYRQVNFSGLSSVPVYQPPYFPPGTAPANCEVETKQQIENLVKAQVQDEIAELKAMVKEVLASQGTNKS